MPAALEISSLQKTYANGFEALKGIDLKVPEGDFFALLGPNGAGKSTTIGIVSSLVSKSGGKVRICGQRHRCLHRGVVSQIPSGTQTQGSGSPSGPRAPDAKA